MGVGRATSQNEELFNDYDGFVAKFAPKLTTDDCYTTPQVYDAVVEWACREYGFDRSAIVRPFYPGGDYENFYYPDNCVVVDNPPFSILGKIVKFYLDKGIRFFLFCQGTTAFQSKGVCAICTGAQLVYDNGAKVNTSFLTNLEQGIRARTAPKLLKMIVEANKQSITSKPMPKYEYPDEVVTASALSRLSKHGIDYSIASDACIDIDALDSQKDYGKSVFGNGLLLSERAAAERAAAERAAAERAASQHWQLSAREIELQHSLG